MLCRVLEWKIRHLIGMVVSAALLWLPVLCLDFDNFVCFGMYNRGNPGSS